MTFLLDEDEQQEDDDDADEDVAGEVQPVGELAVGAGGERRHGDVERSPR